MKQKIDAFDCAEHIMKALKKGILLNTCADKFNSMVIGWGHLGVIWGKPTFAVYVREHRYTKSQLDKTGEFTISIPLGEPDAQINRICGMESGRDIDKAQKAHLTLAPAESVSVPGVMQYPLTLECRVLYSQKQELDRLPDAIRKSAYPESVDGKAPLANRDAHTVYIGQIVNAYILKED